MKTFKFRKLFKFTEDDMMTMGCLFEIESKCKGELEKFSELKSFHSKILIELVLKTLVFLLYDLDSDTLLFECYK